MMMMMVLSRRRRRAIVEAYAHDEDMLFGPQEMDNVEFCWLCVCSLSEITQTTKTVALSYL